MAVTLTSAPSGDFLTIGRYNTQRFLFSASASETWLQLRLNDGTTDYELKPVPFRGTAATVDLSPYIASLFTNDDNTDNSRNQGAAFGTDDLPIVTFTIEQRNSGNGTYASIGGTYTVANASRQIGEASNLDDFAPTLGTASVILAEGSLLTKRTRPKLFWYSDVATPASASDVSVWQQQIGYAVPAFDPSITKTQLWYKGGSLVFSTSGTDSFNDSGVSGISEAEDYVWQADELIVQLKEASGGDVFAQLTFDVVRACINPIAVKWLNTLGVWETYVFEGDAPTALETETVDEYAVPITNTATATETERATEKRRRDVVEVFADNLTINEAEALAEILTSPNVLIYTGELASGIAFDEWQGVIAEGNPTINRNLTKQTFSCTLRKPEYIAQRN